MKQSVFLVIFVLAFAFLNALAPALAGGPEAALAAVRELGAVNGQAMACSEPEAARRAKALMLAHAPKSQTWGDAFQISTHEAFLAQGKGGVPCPTAPALEERLSILEKKLKEVLPVQSVPPTPPR